MTKGNQHQVDAVIPWNPMRQKNHSRLPPTWSADELCNALGHHS
jgi:hypothetical protein